MDGPALATGIIRGKSKNLYARLYNLFVYVEVWLLLGWVDHYNRMTRKNEFHVYASTKTTTQLFFDMAATCSHVFTVFVLLNIQAEKREFLWSFLFYTVLSTIGLQLILAVGLFTLRLMTLDYEQAHNGTGGRTAISRWAHKLNNIGFYACLLVSLLEVLIAGLEKLALDSGHSSGANESQCPVLQAPAEE